MSKKPKQVIIFLDTDKHASPFDALMAVDIFPEAQILTYSNVDTKDAQKLVQDAIFPRGPEGAKYTKLFIGGQDVEKANTILDIATKSMFPPFELSIILDPRGAHTTASAAVAKTFEALKRKGEEDFKDKTVGILAATGPVGQIAASIYAAEGAGVIVTSRDRSRAEVLAKNVNSKLGIERIKGVKASTSEEFAYILSESDLILGCGAGGIQLLSNETMKNKGGRCKVIADTNAIPPSGIEGLKSTADCVEFVPGILGIGALTIGTLKNKVEARLLRKAMDSAKGVFDYREGYEIAKSIVLSKLEKKEK